MLINLKKHIKTIKLYVDYIYRSSGKWSIYNLLLMLFNTFIPFAVLYAIKFTIDEITAQTNNNNSNTDYLYVLITITGFLFLLQQVFSFLQKYTSAQQSERVKDFILNIIQKKTANLHYSCFENATHNDLIMRISTEMPYRSNTIVYSLFGLLQNGVSLFITGILLSSFHWSLFFVLLIVSVPVMLIRWVYSKKIYQWTMHNNENQLMVNYLNRILTTTPFAKELKLFNLTNEIKNRYKKQRLYVRNGYLKLIKNKSIFTILTTTIVISTIFIMLAFIAEKTITKTISIGSMVLFFMLIQRGFKYFNSLSSALSQYTEDKLFINKFFEFLNLKEENNTQTKIKTFPKTISKGIELKNIHFKYPNKQNLVLNDLSISIPVGKTTALVGENGSGKSTIVKLLTNLYKPQSGEILVDNIPYNALNPIEIRQNISAVFQDFVLYHMSVKDNIWFGDTTKPQTEITDAAKQSGIQNIIEDLPKKYETILGTLFKNSRELSRGEWQKLAIARAFYKNAPILLLDEPTSALDAKAEFEIFDKLLKLVQNKTTLIISHRFSTVKMADLIYVLNNGKIIETGNHDTLMQLNGKYAEMYNIQSQWI